MVHLKLEIAIGVALSTAVLCAVLWNFEPSSGSRKKRRTVIEVRETFDTKADKKYMQFEDWLSGTFSSKSFYPNWISDSEYATRNDDGTIVKKKISTGVETELLSSSAWDSVENPFGFSISADQMYIAITFNNKVGYAHYMNMFSVIFFYTSNSTRVDTTDFPPDKIQKIKWDPIGHKMAFVHNFDIYILSDISEAPFPITSDGKENVKFNGVTDWIHNFEITNDDALLWWSPSATRLAYATIDQTDVEKFDFALFESKIYPEIINFPYPKPGTPITITKTFVIETENLEAGSLEADPSDKVKTWGDFYLNSAVWQNDSIFTLTWKNRFENESVSENCVNVTGKWECTHGSVMESRSDTGWLGHYKPADLVVIPMGNEYITVSSDANGYPHLVVVDMEADAKVWRTSGTFEVTDTNFGDQSIYFYDDANDWVYFTSTENAADLEKGLPRIRHMWRVKAHGENITRECITCTLNDVYINRCNWVRPSFSLGGSYVVINCGGTGNGAPISTLHEISSSGNIGEPKVVENNAALLNNLDTYYFRTREYGSINLPGVEGEFYFTLHLPPNFDSNKKYPMLVQVYSGPGWQLAEDMYNADWARGYIASSDLDVIVMTFDGRGTGFRGDKIMHMVYRRLGEYEPLDQIEAARQLSTSLAYIDKTKIAIWGRSYGGYVTSRVIAEDVNQVFKCGFAVAPVTDWLTYSTIYTEKYMGSPDADNEGGYGKSTAIQKLENFGKHYFILVHGTSDENVHFLNSARLSKSLIDQGVDFGNYFAGDETHKFTKYPNGYGHHYKLLTKQLKTCFNL